jgi:nucleoside-diphosphate-sugar epimerase
MSGLRSVLVTGGAGYVGSALVPKLLARGHRVTVLDLYLFGDDVLAGVRGHPDLREVRGDIRDTALLRRECRGIDAVVHLACISNDPSFELNPELGRSINYDAFGPLVRIARGEGVRRFVYASSSSVYGIKDEENVTEELALAPLTDYSKYKALCEEVLLREQAPGFTTLILRPATVCGWAPRLRLDLSVNILTNHAVNTRRIKVFGGGQRRPNIHIDDVTDLYVKALEYPDALVAGEVFNAGYQNATIAAIAETVRAIVGPESVAIETVPTDDHRSYHISSDKIRRVLGYAPTRTIEDAVRDLRDAFRAGRVPDPLEDPRYYNIKTMLGARL